MNIRLSQKDIDIIKSTAIEVFGEDIDIYIFGSRVDPTRKGGDIDIMIEKDAEVDLSLELKFLALLEKRGIERKVDIVVKTPNSKDHEIFKEAKEKGVKI